MHRCHCPLAFGLNQEPYDLAWTTFQLLSHLVHKRRLWGASVYLTPAGPPGLDDAVDWGLGVAGGFLFFIFFFWLVFAFAGNDKGFGEK